MPKVLLVSSITHDQTEYLPGLHEVSEELLAQWKEEAPHVLSPIPVEATGKTVRAADAPENQETRKKTPAKEK